MASIGRQVADAFIEIHGDLAPFRKALDRAGGLVDNFGAKLKGLGGLNVLEDSFRYGIDFMQNIDRHSVRLAQMVSGVGALGAALTNMLGATAIIGQDIAALSGIGLLAPAFLTGFGIAMGVAIAALKDMKTVLADLAPAFADLQNYISEQFWSAAADPIRDMVNNLMPTLRFQLGITANMLGSLAGEFARAFGETASPERVTVMFERMNQALFIVRQAVAPLVRAFVNLGEVGSEYFGRAAEAIVAMSERFDAFIQKSKDNGDLNRWIEGAIQGFKDLGRLIAGTVGVLGSIGDAARAAGIGGLKEMADRMQAASDIMNSPRFQNAMTSLFRGVSAATEGIIAGIGRIGPALEVAMPTIERAFGSIGDIGRRVGTMLATVIANPVLLAGFESFVGNIVTALDKLAPAMTPFANSLGGLLDLMGEVLVAVAELSSAVIQKLGPIFDRMGAQMQRLVGPLSDALLGIVDVLTPIFAALESEVLTPVVDIIIADVLPLATKIAEAFGPTLVTVLEEIGKLLTDVVGPAFEKLNDGFDPQKANDLGHALEGVITVMDALIASASSDQSLWEWLDSEPMRQFSADVNQELENFWGTLGGMMDRMNADVNQGLSDFWAGVGAQLATWGAAFMESWNGFWGGLGTEVAVIWESITQQFGQHWTNIQTSFQTWLTQIGEGWNTFWTGFGESVNLIWTGLLVLLQTWWTQITESFNNTFVVPFNQFWDAFWNGLDPKLRLVLEGIGLALSMAWNNIVTTVQSFIANFGTNWDNFWNNVGATNHRKWQETIDGFNRWANDINTTVRNFINDVVNNWNKFWGDVFNRASNEWNRIVGGFNTWANQINTTVRGFINEVMGNWNRFWGDVFNRASQSWNQIIGGFNNWAATINNTVRGFINQVIGEWNRFWGDVGARVQNGWNQVTGAFNSGVAVIRGVISGFVATAQAQWNGFWNTVSSLAQIFMGVLVSTVSSRINEVINWFRQLPAQAGGALAGMANQLFSVGVNMIQGLINGVRAMAGNVVNAARAVVGGAIDAAKRLLNLGSPSKLFHQFGEWTGEGLAGGISDTKRLVARAVEGIANAAIGVLAKSEMFAAGASAAAGLAEGLSSNKSMVKTALGGVSLDLAATTKMGTLPGNSAAVGIPTATGETIRGGVTVAEGAIVIQAPQSDAGLVAKKTLDELVETFG